MDSKNPGYVCKSLLKRAKSGGRYMLVLGLCLSLCSGAFMPIGVKTADAASKRKVTLKIGKNKAVRYKGLKGKIKIKVTKKGIIKIVKKTRRKAVIKGVSAGRTKLIIKAGRKKYTYVVKVIGAGSNGNSENSGNTATSTPSGSSVNPGTTNNPGTTSNPGTTVNPGTTSNPGTTVNPAETSNPETTVNPSGENQPSKETINYDAGEYSINNVHSGDGTFYDRVSTGAANLDAYESIYYTAAMNNEDYMNGLAGAYVEITDKDGDKINVLITDRLPEGKKGDIDLTRKTFNVIEPEVTGRMLINWRIIPLPTDEPISYLFKPTSSQYWAEVQVRNHRYPIAKLEYLDASGKYQELVRQEYNYFTASSGMGMGPFTFRVTDIYGHVLIDNNITMDTSETPVLGAANFPY